MRHRYRNRLIVSVALSAAGLVMGMLANPAGAATSYYLDLNGATSGFGITSGSTYSWDSSVWSTSSAGTAATTAWGAGGFARFDGGSSGNAYIVTVGADESMAGLYEMISGVSVTINQTGGGDLNITTAGGGVPIGGSGATLQGFLINGSGSTVIINAPITGAGGVEQELAGSLALYGNNSYSGGTETTGGQVLYYNNNNSFGTGNIYITGTSGQGLVNSGPAGVTIANNVVFGSVGTSTNIVGGPASGSTAGTIFTGTFTLPTSGTTTLQAGSATTTVDEIRGVISGSSSLKVTGSGTLVLSAVNAYTGTTTVSGPVRLKLGAANAIASSSSLILAGGTLNSGGFNQNMSATTLSLTSSSIIDFSAGASELDFADSSALTWAGTLNLTGWNPTIDALRFGTGGAGLTAAQLAAIEFNGGGLGTGHLDSNGYLVFGVTASAPEPGTLALFGMGLTIVSGALFRIPRRRGRAA